LIVAFTTQYVELKHQYRGLHKVLGMFVPRGVVERLVNNAERLAWIRDSAFGACVATDGERYTALADQLTPVELSRFLNRYFQTLFPPVASRQGWVSDVVGDSMLAVWAEARPNPRVREQACQAALEMLSASQRFATKMPTRIGVDFGPIALSTLGAGTHWEYRPVGAVPNTANRLQALNKRLGTKLLVSEAVVEGLNGFVARDLGWFLLRGKESPTRVYELISEREHASDEQVGLCAAFASALERFQAGDLAVAGLQFDALQAQHDDGPARFFALLCRQHAAHVGGVVVIND
jgi:adenylate cyclase